jgi:predicted transcriptional regulator
MQEESIFLNQKGYGIVGKIVMQDKRLNRMSKLLYSYLKCFVNKDNICFPPKNMICADLDISKNTFEKYIKELVSAGYISISQNRTNGKFTNNVYYFNDKVTVPQFTEHHSTVYDSTALDQVTTNNTIYNNTILKNTISQNHRLSRWLGIAL